VAETMAVAGLDIHARLTLGVTACAGPGAIIPMTHGAAVHMPSGELVQIRFGRRGRAGAVAARPARRGAGVL
jgi:hypothetical protein